MTREMKFFVISVPVVTLTVAASFIFEVYKEGQERRTIDTAARYELAGLDTTPSANSGGTMNWKDTTPHLNLDIPFRRDDDTLPKITIHFPAGHITWTKVYAKGYRNWVDDNGRDTILVAGNSTPAMQDTIHQILESFRIVDRLKGYCELMISGRGEETPTYVEDNRYNEHDSIHR